jgi:hypothetical protein
MATDYSSENPPAQLARLLAEQPHVERLAEAASMWETAQYRIRSARVELLGRTNELEGSWRDDAGIAFGRRVDESVDSLKAWYEKVENSRVIEQIKALQLDFPHCLAQVRAIGEQFDAARKAQAAGGGGGIDPAMVEREFSKFAAQFTNHIADLFDAVTRAMGVLGDLSEWNGPRQEGDGQQGNGDVGSQIVEHARGEIGTKEGAGHNENPYGPAVEWCSLFATEMWQRAGVDISDLENPAFTGNVYTWGEQHGLAYDANNLSQARPGDVLLFGTGPESTDSSEHIGIVESVDLENGTVTTIEGNAGANIDEVVRNTHDLKSFVDGGEFYGGVHPR